MSATWNICLELNKSRPKITSHVFVCDSDNYIEKLFWYFLTVPSFRFFVPGEHAKRALTPVFVPGEHPNVPSFGTSAKNHPFGTPPFCQPLKSVFWEGQRIDLTSKIRKNFGGHFFALKSVTRKRGCTRMTPVRFRFGGGPVRAVPVFGSGGSAKGVFCVSVVFNKKGRFRFRFRFLENGSGGSGSVPEPPCCT